jgi:hypothetical protein
MRDVLFRHLPPWEQPAVQAPVGPLGLTRALTPVMDQRARPKGGRRTTRNRSHGDHRNSEISTKHAESVMPALSTRAGGEIIGQLD